MMWISSCTYSTRSTVVFGLVTNHSASTVSSASTLKRRRDRISATYCMASMILSTSETGRSVVMRR